MRLWSLLLLLCCACFSPVDAVDQGEAFDEPALSPALRNFAAPEETTSSNGTASALPPIIGDAPAISVGTEFACALTAARTVKCWGRNDKDQLGVDTAPWYRDTAELVPGLDNVSRLHAGFIHACALTLATGLKCWGWNAYGQLGDGNVVEDRIASVVDVMGLQSGVTSVGVGDWFTCATRASGEVLCWGYHSRLSLQGPGIRSATPQPVPGITDAVQVVAGGGHICVLHRDTTVSCWGNNDDGQLGDGTKVSRPKPQRVANLQNVVELQAGYFATCALTADRKLYCWGKPDGGQLLATGADSTLPALQPLPGPVKQFSIGSWSAAALLASGEVYRWGMGVNSTWGTIAYSPVLLGGLPPIREVRAGAQSWCVLTTAGDVLCLGSNAHGACGVPVSYVGSIWVTSPTAVAGW